MGRYKTSEMLRHSAAINDKASDEFLVRGHLLRSPAARDRCRSAGMRCVKERGSRTQGMSSAWVRASGLLRGASFVSFLMFCVWVLP